MKILICGRSGVGKDTLRAYLEEQGLTAVLSTTNRPKRSETEDTHRFVDEKTALAEYPTAIAHTVINGYHYYATEEEVKAKDIYIVDLEGIKACIDRMPQESFLLVHLVASLEQRKAAALSRAVDKIKEETVWNARIAAEDESFTELSHYLLSAKREGVESISMVNDFQPKTLQNMAKRIKHFSALQQAFLEFGLSDIEAMGQAIDSLSEHSPCTQCFCYCKADGCRLSLPDEISCIQDLQRKSNLKPFTLCPDCLYGKSNGDGYVCQLKEVDEKACKFYFMRKNAIERQGV